MKTLMHTDWVASSDLQSFPFGDDAFPKSTQCDNKGFSNYYCIKIELKVHISNKKKCNFLYFVFFCVLHFVFCIYFMFLKIKAALLHQDWVESFDLQYNYCHPFNLHFFCILYFVIHNLFKHPMLLSFTLWTS